MKLLNALTSVVTEDGKPTDVLERPDIVPWWWAEGDLRWDGWIRKQTIESAIRRGWVERDRPWLRIAPHGIDELREASGTAGNRVSRGG